MVFREFDISIFIVIFLRGNWVMVWDVGLLLIINILELVWYLNI